MSARNSPNLRRWGEEWGGALDMARRWKIECFEFAMEGSYWITIANVKRKRIPNSRGSYRKTSRAKTSTDTRHRQQISVRWTQCTSWSVMFKNRVQVSRLSGVDGLVYWTLGPDTTWMGDCSRAGKLSGYVNQPSRKTRPSTLCWIVKWVSAFGLSNNDGDGGCSFLAAYRRAYSSSLWAWSVGPRVGGHLALFCGHLALFCIHCINRVYGTLVVTSWTCYSAL